MLWETPGNRCTNARPDPRNMTPVYGGSMKGYLGESNLPVHRVENVPDIETHGDGLLP